MHIRVSHTGTVIAGGKRYCIDVEVFQGELDQVLVGLVSASLLDVPELWSC